MDDTVKQAADGVFRYPTSSRERRHGPAGYADYQSFKPWLRDEFLFRCIYCLCRETWEPNGHRTFSVEHIRPRSARDAATETYENLAYACCTCNSAREDRPLPLDVAAEPLADHLSLNDDGTIEALTDDGARLRDICQLNRESLVEFRRRLRMLLDFLVSSDAIGAAEIAREILAFPHDLPDLATRRPPGGNFRPQGIGACCYEQRQRNELPDVYY